MKLTLLALTLLLVSCAGYRFKRNDNPLEQYGIRKLAIPMFLNRSILPDVSGKMTRSFFLLLSQFKNLKVYAGEGPLDIDAALIGIIHSSDYINDVERPETRQFTTGGLEDSIGENRGQFYVVDRSVLHLELEVILIKNPTHQIIKTLTSPVGQLVQSHPRIVFREKINLENGFSRQLFANRDADGAFNPDLGGPVNYTQNQGILRETVTSMAESAARTFKDTILYAF